jgi:predicted NUDIX family NTP pyrophosphohydrolase
MQDLQVLLGHPGGPYWTGRDDGAWSIPKGESTPARIITRPPSGN